MEIRKGTIPRLRSHDYRSLQTYFITFCVRDRTPTFNSKPAADIARSVILEYRERGWFYVLAYAIMPDHVHLLMRLRSRDRTLSRIVATIKNRMTQYGRGRDIPIRWQWGFHDHVRRPSESPGDVAQYIVANPVRAGLVVDAADYPFCGIIDDWTATQADPV